MALTPVAITAADIALSSMPDKVAGVIDLSYPLVRPEWGLFPARTINGTSFTQLAKTQKADRINFSSIGADSSGGQGPKFQPITHTIKYLKGNIVTVKDLTDEFDRNNGGTAGAYWSIAVADKYSETQAGLSDDFWNSDSLLDPDSFDGLRVRHGRINTGFKLDVGGNDSAACTEIWGITVMKSPLDTGNVAWVLRNGEAFLNIPQPVTQLLETSSGKSQMCYVAEATGWVGMQYADRFAAFKIYNVDVSPGSTLTDSVIASAYAVAPTGWKPDMWLMTQRSATQITGSRLATSITVPNPSGDPWGPSFAGFDNRGVPFIVTDSLSNTLNPA